MTWERGRRRGGARTRRALMSTTRSGSELGVRIADAAGELLGMHALVNEGSELVPDAPRWFNRLVAARQYTISAGTREIQRNILGERVLGLDKGYSNGLEPPRSSADAVAHRRGRARRRPSAQRLCAGREVVRGHRGAQ